MGKIAGGSILRKIQGRRRGRSGLQLLGKTFGKNHLVRGNTTLRTTIERLEADYNPRGIFKGTIIRRIFGAKGIRRVIFWKDNSVGNNCGGQFDG